MKLARPGGLRYALDVLTRQSSRSTSSLVSGNNRTVPCSSALLFNRRVGGKVCPNVSSRHVSSTSNLDDEDDDDFFGAPFEGVEEEPEPVTVEKLDSCESWVYDLHGNRMQVISLNPDIFGLPPRLDILTPIVLRQLKYKHQDEPYGSEENNFIEFDRVSDTLYEDRPYLKPWIKQGLAWNTMSYTLPTPITSHSTRHLPVPHYNGKVPRKLRELGTRVVCSLKHRYNKLLIIDSLSTPDRYMEPEKLRELLDELDVPSALMITGARITPHYKSEFWKRKEKFPVENPGSQRFWKTATYTTGCELREIEGLDVWSALLYDTLILDLAALQELEETLDLAKFQTPNISLRKTLEKLENGGSIGPSRKRHKVVRVVNIDNL